MGKNNIQDIYEKVVEGERVSYEEGVRLYASNDLITLGAMASLIRQRKHGDYVYFNKNRHINPTNVCAFHCNFCSFARTSDDRPGAYTFMPEQVINKIRPTVDEGITEFHIVGGLHPDKGFQYYIDLLEALKDTYSWVHLKAFTAVEIDFFCQLENKDAETILRELIEAGLDSMPGGGAEIFHWDVRRKICPEKANAERWLEIHSIAHKLGLMTNATMLYGHIEEPHHRVHHLVQLREQQDKDIAAGYDGRFQTFIPLSFHPMENGLGRRLKRRWTSGVDDMKTLAVSRVMLDNFAHIKAYWIMLSPAMAQIGLDFGANDIDGTVVEEHIYHDAGAQTKEHMSRSDLMRLIRAAGRTPVERDTVYNVVKVHA
ncbi:MAG: aminofutalosine synthase MqnE [Ardenticatenaceae bacterium]|nr:aminofutalosine synthase MqnE [Ardenticatenaceae bacterium]